MNSILLILALGGLDATGSRATSIVATPNLPHVSIAHPDSRLVFQEVKWPKVDPRNSTKSKWESSAPNETDGATKGGAPAIRRKQLDEQTPNYEKKAPPATKPLVKAREASEEDADDEVARPGARNQSSGGSRFGRHEQVEEPVSETRPRFGESNSREFPDRESEFTSTPAMKVNVRRQSGESRESAPNPFEFRPATISDDREETPRRAPFRSFAIGADEPEDNFGVDPYSEPLGSNRRNNEYLASNGGNSRDSKFPANGDDDSTMQGGKRMPETNSNTMWGFAVVTLLLFASMGANAYLAWVAREFYERYRSLAQQVRASRNNMT